MSKTLDFKVICFEAFKAKYQLSGVEAMDIFKKYNVLDYLAEYYDVLHTQGRDYILEDIDIYINVRKRRA